MRTEHARQPPGQQALQGTVAKDFEDRVTLHLATLQSLLLEDHERALGQQMQLLQHNASNAAHNKLEPSASRVPQAHAVRDVEIQARLEWSEPGGLGAAGNSSAWNAGSNTVVLSQPVSPGTSSHHGVAADISESLTNFGHAKRNRSRGVLGQVIKRDTQELLNDLPTATLSGIKQFAAVPDATLGIRHFISHMSLDLFLRLFMNFVVISNILLMGFQAGSDWRGWLIVDCTYVGIFTIELLVKFWIDGLFFFSRHNPDSSWSMFDIFLVALSLFEVIVTFIGQSDEESSGYTWIRIARLVRLARLLRLLQLDMFRDVILMINRAVGGLRTLGWSVFIIMIPVYAFALCLTETVGEKVAREERDEFHAGDHFSSMSRSMFTGFRCLVIGDCSAMNGTPIFPHLIDKYGWVYGVLYCVASVCMTFGLFNVIVAVYVENTMASTKNDEMIQRHRRLEDHGRFAEKVFRLTRFLWSQQHPDKPETSFTLTDFQRMEISKEFYASVAEHQRMHMLLEALDVPREDHIDLFDICDADGSGTLNIDELVVGIKRLRGDARRSDIVFVMLRVRELMQEFQEFKAEVLLEVKSLKKDLKSIKSLTAVHPGWRPTEAHKVAI